MASIKKRGKTFSVIYNCLDDQGRRKQKWETYRTKEEAMRRKKEIEYKNVRGPIVIPRCRTLRELIQEYVDLYGREKWAISTYYSNNCLIKNYINPLIGDTKLSDINTRFLETFYQRLQKTKAVPNRASGSRESELVGYTTIRDAHRFLRSCFEQAVKWEIMEKNPAINANVPKFKVAPREIWTADVMMKANELCQDPVLKLAMNLAFSASLRIGEAAGLTWDCVDVSEDAIAQERAYIYINKEFQRLNREALKELNGKDVMLIFPSDNVLGKTVRVLKTPKTESSVRKIYIPRSVADMLVRHKKEQDEVKDLLGDAYHDYNLVLTTAYGMPLGVEAIRDRFNRFVRVNQLPKVVFHSLRHTSVTYKLKLNGGDIKSVQGDSGHARVEMVTDVYSHIIDEDRRKNAVLFEDAFYGKNDPDTRGEDSPDTKTITVPEGVDAEALARVLANPEMMALLNSMAKAMQS